MCQVRARPSHGGVCTSLPVHRICALQASSQPSPQRCLGHTMQGNRKARPSRAPGVPLPHEVGTGPRPPAALVDSLDHRLGAVLHLAGDCPCHRVMAPVPVGTATVALASAIPRRRSCCGERRPVKMKYPQKQLKARRVDLISESEGAVHPSRPVK